MFTDGMMSHDRLVDYLKEAGIGRQNQIKVLQLIWKKEKGGWDPPHEIKKRLDKLRKARE